jgi:hypothetical protein
MTPDKIGMDLSGYPAGKPVKMAVWLAHREGITASRAHVKRKKS